MMQLLFIMVQVGASLRFNELQGDEISESALGADEGRRRRRRRRRRGGGWTPSSTGPTARFTFLEEFMELPVALAVANQGSGAAPLNTIVMANGWLNQHVLTASEDTLYTGVQSFNFQNKKFHMYETRVAFDDQSDCDWFVGLSAVAYVAAEADPGDGIGFWSLGSATSVAFVVMKDGAGTSKVVQSKLTATNAGNNLVLLDSGVTTQTGTVVLEPVVSYRLGYSYIPEGQFGVAAAVGATGEYRVFLEGAQVGKYTATAAANPDDLQLQSKSIATGTGAACNFKVDYIQFTFDRQV